MARDVVLDRVSRWGSEEFRSRARPAQADDVEGLFFSAASADVHDAEEVPVLAGAEALGVGAEFSGEHGLSDGAAHLFQAVVVAVIRDLADAAAGASELGGEGGECAAHGGSPEVPGDRSPDMTPYRDGRGAAGMKMGSRGPVCSARGGARVRALDLLRKACAGTPSVSWKD